MTVEGPALVRLALDLARRSRFEHSCTPEVGRLLSVLASRVRGGVVGEIGTGCGVGTAWMASALAVGVSLVTVEFDQTRAEAVRSLFADVPNVCVLDGDWHRLLAYGPFDLLFADGGRAKEREPETLVGALKPGGTVLLDDLTPEALWPEEWRGLPDPVREFWLNDPRLAATEILTAPTEAAIVATRR
jgi:predicted O-methyltransferase YrrM